MNRARAVFCALWGHSYRIVTNCFGYKYCGRCGQQVGDSLGGYWDGSRACDINCACNACRKQWESIPWWQRLLIKTPKWTGLTPEETDIRNRQEMNQAVQAMKAWREEREAERAKA